jgi:hypothetical protein
MGYRLPDGQDVPSCDTCLFPMIKVVASWWCPTCKLRYTQDELALD